MSLGELKFLYALSCIALGLIILSPTLALTVQLPSGERFNELWVLGPGHTAMDYPFNVDGEEAFQVYLGVGNHMDSLKHYRIYVKLRNQTEALPNATLGTFSPLKPLHEFQVFLRDGETWEASVNFSFPEFSFGQNESSITSIVLNGAELAVNKEAAWDAQNGGYYYQIFFELWIHNADPDDFVFHNQFVGLWLNMTGGS